MLKLPLPPPPIPSTGLTALFLGALGPGATGGPPEERLTQLLEAKKVIKKFLGSKATPFDREISELQLEHARARLAKRDNATNRKRLGIAERRAAKEATRVLLQEGPPSPLSTLLGLIGPIILPMLIGIRKK